MKKLDLIKDKINDLHEELFEEFTKILEDSTVPIKDKIHCLSLYGTSTDVLSLISDLSAFVYFDCGYEDDETIMVDKLILHIAGSISKECLEYIGLEGFECINETVYSFEEFKIFVDEIIENKIGSIYIKKYL